ncbi:nucleotidyltransferase domain-containing protein [Streptococcus mitis]|uniref:nucleotidyltransferase family protein n=1 Tax=Streptococcus mitis TaxID=28037 RepID=UPI0029E826B7|nr:nucleotidyltransferase domain-containing protein [Streptococcus mitis]
MVYKIDEIKAKINPIAKQYNLSKVYLFGSYAIGEADEKSDVDIALELEDESTYFEVYGKLLTIFDGEIDILLVSDLLFPKTNIGKLVKQNFLNDRVLIYQKLEGTMVENLDNNPRMRDISE